MRPGLSGWGQGVWRGAAGFAGMEGIGAGGVLSPEDFTGDELRTGGGLSGVDVAGGVVGAADWAGVAGRFCGGWEMLDEAGNRGGFDGFFWREA